MSTNGIKEILSTARFGREHGAVFAALVPTPPKRPAWWKVWRRARYRRELAHFKETLPAAGGLEWKEIEIRCAEGEPPR